MTLKRHTSLRPGYDCIRTPCGKGGCGERPGANHGIHCDEWYYVLSDGEVAVSLAVLSGVWPKTVPFPQRSAISVYPRGVTLAVHAAFPTGASDVQAGTSECEYVDAGRCYAVATWSGLAETVWNELPHRDGFAQERPFWLAFERRYRKLTKDVRKQRGHACTGCDGTGFVRGAP